MEMESDRTLLTVPSQAEIGGAFQRLQAVFPHSIITEFLERLSSPALKELGLEWGVMDELEKLGNIVSTSAPLLAHAEKDSPDWVGEFVDAIYGADDLVNDFFTEAQERQAMAQNNWAKKVRIFFSSSNQLAFRLDSGRKFKAVRKKLHAVSPRFHILPPVDENKTGSSCSGVRMYNKSEEILSSFSMPPLQVIIGREKEKLEIVEKLLDCNSFHKGENVSFVSVIGEMGIGKTALARLVYNDEQITNHFQLKMWVCVSGNGLALKTIAKEMIESATGKKLASRQLLDHHHKDDDRVAVLQDLLRKEIDRKRFLLVLDDVWRRDYDSWPQLRAVLVGGERGSKILLTSSENVSSACRLRRLSDEESWSLFKQIGYKHKEEQHIQQLFKKIVKRCNGHPLAVRASASLCLAHTQDTHDEYSALENHMQIMDYEFLFILPVLKWNYDYLPSYLKRCFELCFLYLKDGVIYKKDLIRLWIAHGLIQPVDQTLDLEENGDLYFVDLLRRAFFQDVEKDEWGDMVSCKMHQLIHDLARGAAQKDYFVLRRDASDVPSTIHHVSFDPCENTSMHILDRLCTVNKIRTFLLHGQGIGFGDPNKLVSKILELTRLRVLDLHCLGINMLPSRISKLQYLRYLDLSDNRGLKSLPSSITTLRNLQTLKLSGCCHLQELPRETRKLVSLRHLELDGCIGLSHMPWGLGQLTSLRTLTLFILDRDSIASKHSAGLSELKGLNNLRGELMIEGLGQLCSASATTEKEEEEEEEEEDTIQEAKYLEGKQHLQSLQLKWANIDDDDDELVLIFQAFQPHQNLKRLSVTGYGGLSLPSWMMKIGASLPNLVKITITNCSRCQELPQFEQLQFLQILELSQLASVEYIHNSSSTNGGGDDSPSSLPSSSTGGREPKATFFPSLKKLLLNGLTNLKGWWRCEAEETIAFPSLSVSTIQNCPKLASMPLHPCVEELELMRVSEKLVQQQFTMMAKPGDPMLPSSSSSAVPLPKLKSLCIQYIDDLVTLPQRAIESLASLRFLEISWCPGLTSLSGVMGDLTALEKLEINDCPVLDLSGDDNGMQFQGLRSLTSLKIKRIPKLVSLPVGLQHVTTLKSLQIERCEELISLGEWIGKLRSLQQLVIFECHKLTSLHRGMQHLKALISLEIDGCQKLDLSDDDGGMKFRGLRNLSSLTIKRNPMLVSLPRGLQYDSSLQFLEIYICENLTALPDWIGYLTSLKRLSIYGCPKLASLPDGMHGLPRFTVLSIQNCHPSLYERCHEKTGEDWPKIAHISNASLR